MSNVLPQAVPLLIGIEGLDAAGKTEQSRLLCEAVGGVGYHFPNDASESGKLIRKMLKAGHEATGFDKIEYARVMQSLFAVNRLEMLHNIEQHRGIEQVDVVVDRYAASGMVYGRLDGLEERWLFDIHRTLPMPHLYILLDITARESFLRRPERQDRYEKDFEFLGNVRRGYLDFFKFTGPVYYPNTRWVVIDASAPIDIIHHQILAEVQATRRAIGERIYGHFAKLIL